MEAFGVNYQNILDVPTLIAQTSNHYRYQYRSCLHTYDNLIWLCPNYFGQVQIRLFSKTQDWQKAFFLIVFTSLFMNDIIWSLSIFFNFSSLFHITLEFKNFRKASWIKYPTVISMLNFFFRPRLSSAYSRKPQTKFGPLP